MIDLCAALQENGKGDLMITRAERIERALQQAFFPSELVVTDESAAHAGHAGAGDRSETHYTVQVVSSVFTGMRRIARSQAVHTALAAEFASGLHALSLRLRAPDEQHPTVPQPWT